MPIALVTGGAIRVGRAIVEAVATAGYDVLIHARRSHREATELAAEMRAHGVRAWALTADLEAEDGPFDLARQVLACTTTLDLLVHNAADYEHAAFEDISPARFASMMATNVRAPFFLTQALLPLLRAAQAGACIINITDMALDHVYTRSHVFSHYLASKAGLMQLTRAWALELGPAIRVNAVAPGPVAVAGETSELQRREIVTRTPLAREGTPHDIAGAVVYLAGAPYVTGQVLRVDGGLSVG
jgi:pteridine reductase